MNYQKIYNNLIHREITRAGYIEKHHILPRCLGGLDNKENLVNLYPEEHYLAHLLLCKIHPGNQKLLYAAMNMTTRSMINKGKRNNKAYGWLRRQYAESMSGDRNPARQNPNLQKEAAKKRIGQKRTEETKAKMSVSQKAKAASFETHPNAGKVASLETRAKMSASKRSQVQSEETKRKRSESIAAWHKQRKEQICL